LNPVCRHFGTCGGCSLQDLSPDAYRDFKRALIVDALSRHGLDPSALKDIVAVPPHSRRRATFKVEKRAGETHLGFHAARSHDIVDLRECLVLTHELFACAQGLRDMMNAILRDGDKTDIYVLQAANGFDVAIDWKRSATPSIIAAVAPFARKLGLIRVTAGRDLITESAVPEIAIGKARLNPPPNAFLQPTREGEAALQGAVLDIVGKSKTAVDLFSGCGTFALVLAKRMRTHAVDSDTSMLEALASAARAAAALKPLTTERRDLFKLPLAPDELSRFEAVVLDPPRAGALAQATQLAKSRIKRIAYVSCDAASFARDARVLVDGGFRLAEILGVDQFLWSAHVELAAAFTRD